MNNNDMEQKTKELEGLLNQLFTLDANDPRRKEIDSILTSYKSRNDAYEHTKYYLTHAKNQYVIWFSLSILESKVNKSWQSLNPQEQNEAKGLVFDLYLNNNRGLPSYNITKLGQVIADIGRYDFQLNSQDYITNIISLINNPSTSLRGINLLQYISEEFTTSKEVLSQNTKNILRRMLLERVPTIIDCLTTSLNQLLDQTSHPDSNTYETKTKAIFDALLSYFSWIPLNEFLTPGLLETLFRYLENSNVASLTCLNEILSKNCVPREFQEFLVRVFDEINKLMNHIILNNNISQHSPSFIDKFTQFISLFVSNHLRRVENNPNFSIEAFLASLFQYTLLQSSTLSDSFKTCIEIWNTFLDYLLVQLNENGVAAPPKYAEGLIQLQSEMVKRILFTINNTFLSQLEDDDDNDNDNDNDNSEDSSTDTVTSYINSSIDIITKITELYPKKGLENLGPLFAQNVTNFFRDTESMISQGVITNRLESIKPTVRDVTTILQLFERLTHLFTSSFRDTYPIANFIFQKLLEMCIFSVNQQIYRLGQEWVNLQNQILSTIRSFSYWLGEYGNQVRGKQPDQTDFDSNISKLILYIIIPLFNSTVPEKISITCGRLLTSLAVISKPLFLFTQMEGVISNIHNLCNPLPTAVQTVVYSAISSTILIPPSNVNLNHQWDLRRPKYSPFIKGITQPYLEIPQIQGFIDAKLYLKEEVIQRIQRVLKVVTSVIKTVPDVSTAKGILHDAIQDILLVTLNLFRVYFNVPQVLESILNFFFTLFETLKTQVGVSFTQQTITTFLEILGGDNINHLLTGKNETGNVIIKRLVEILTFVIQTYGHSFETLLSSIINFAMEKIYPSIIDTVSPIKPLFFTLLYTILDNHWRYFFPTATTANTANSVINTTSSSLNNTNNGLHHSNNSNNSNINNSNSNNNNSNNQQTNNNNSNANTQQQQQLTAILGAFQTTFQRNDVNLFKQNLDHFEKLNNKHKLYEKMCQHSTYGSSLISIFFDSLTSKSQSVNSEDIINTIYHFASINFFKFFNEYFIDYLLKSSLTNEQKSTIKSNFTEDKDHPTFNRNMNQFINDFSYYTFLNL